MKNKADLLPIGAIPYFIRLISLYNKSLEELIDLYHTTQNEMAFSKLLDHLVDDFDYYQASFVHWQKEAKTEADHVSLEALKPLLEESKRLISKAAGIVQH